MKKLNLQLGSIKEMLTKEQMKKVGGGYGGGSGQLGFIECDVFRAAGPVLRYKCIDGVYSDDPQVGIKIGGCLNDCTGTYGIDCEWCAFETWW